MKIRVLEFSRVWPWRWPRGIPHTWYLSAQCFITVLNRVWRESDIVAMNERKKNVSVCKRTVCNVNNLADKNDENITARTSLCWNEEKTFFPNLKKNVFLASAFTLLGLVVRTENGGDGLPMGCYLRATAFWHRCRQYPTVCGSSPQLGHQWSTGVSNWLV